MPPPESPVDPVVAIERPLAGRSAIVTGGSGGIGRQIAVALARGGASRIGIHFHRNQAAAEATADEVTAWAAEAALLSADCGSPAACRQLVDDAFQWLGRPDIWVHAAGADVLTGDAGQWDFEQKLAELWKIDVQGSIVTGRHYARRVAELAEQSPQQSQRSAASLILIGWDQATRGMEGEGGMMFAPIKAAVQAFGKSLAQDAAPHLRVNTVAPGWIRTAWGESVRDYWDRRARGQALMQRWGSGQDVAAAVAFLASPASGFITGQTIDVNGGFNRRWPSVGYDG